MLTVAPQTEFESSLSCLDSVESREKNLQSGGVWYFYAGPAVRVTQRRLILRVGSCAKSLSIHPLSPANC